MDNYRRRKGRMAWFVSGLVILALIIIIVPACRFVEFWVLSNVTNGLFDQYFPTALGPLTTNQEPLFLSSIGNNLFAAVQQMVPDYHTYLINAKTGSLLATVYNQDVLNADRQFYFTGFGNTPQSFYITATRLSDNQSVWQHAFNAGPSGISTQIQDGIFYYASEQEGGTGPSVLFAFSENTGALLWHHVVSKSNGFFYTVNDGSVYILGREGVEALATRNGNVRWFHAVDSSGMYSIVADSTTVYILGERIQALRASDGQQSWALTQGNSVYPPIYDYLGMHQGVLYVSTDYLLRAIEASNGKILWTHLYPRNTNLVPNTLNLSDGSIYWIVDRDVYASRTSDGSQVWHFQDQNATTSSQHSQLLGVLNGTVYVQLHRDLVALQSANGQKVWTFSLPPSTDIKAIMIRQTIYYGYAIHTSNVPPPAHWFTSISQAYYYCSNAIHLSAIKSQSGTLQWQKQYKVTCTR